jgi:hypothetical protein
VAAHRRADATSRPIRASYVGQAGSASTFFLTRDKGTSRGCCGCLTDRTDQSTDLSSGPYVRDLIRTMCPEAGWVSCRVVVPDTVGSRSGHLGNMGDLFGLPPFPRPPPCASYSLRNKIKDV